MKWLKELAHSLGSIFRRSHKEQELSEELQFHLERQIEQNLAAGMPPEEARYAALRLFGGVQQVKEECRDMRRINYIENFLQDVRYGLRQLRRSPGFTTVAVLTLALGIGATTAVFSIVHTVLLKPLLYPEPHRIMRLWMSAPEKGVTQLVFSGPNFVDVSDQSRTFLALAAHRGWPYIVTGGSEPLRVYGQRVSASLFKVLGVAPLMGRTFAPSEDIEGKDSVVVVSYRFWRGYFSGAANIIGRSVMVSDAPRTVIGVMPADFQFPSPDTELWVPLAMTPQDRNRNLETFYVVGRLRDDVSLNKDRARWRLLQVGWPTSFPVATRARLSEWCLSMRT
jgi:putative ABC transport system permease protein